MAHAGSSFSGASKPASLAFVRDRAGICAVTGLSAQVRRVEASCEELELHDDGDAPDASGGPSRWTIEKIEPPSGTRLGFELVTLRGRFPAARDPSLVFVSFGDRMQRPLFCDETKILCMSVPVPQNIEWLPVSVSFNGGRTFTNDELAFEYSNANIAHANCPGSHVMHWGMAGYFANALDVLDSHLDQNTNPSIPNTPRRRFVSPRFGGTKKDTRIAQDLMRGGMSGHATPQAGAAGIVNAYGPPSSLSSAPAPTSTTTFTTASLGVGAGGGSTGEHSRSESQLGNTGHSPMHQSKSPLWVETKYPGYVARQQLVIDAFQREELGVSDDSFMARQTILDRQGNGIEALNVLIESYLHEATSNSQRSRLRRRKLRPDQDYALQSTKARLAALQVQGMPIRQIACTDTSAVILLEDGQLVVPGFGNSSAGELQSLGGSGSNSFSSQLGSSFNGLPHEPNSKQDQSQSSWLTIDKASSIVIKHEDRSSHSDNTLRAVTGSSLPVTPLQAPSSPSPPTPPNLAPSGSARGAPPRPMQTSSPTCPSVATPPLANASPPSCTSSSTTKDRKKSRFFSKPSMDSPRSPGPANSTLGTSGIVMSSTPRSGTARRHSTASLSSQTNVSSNKSKGSGTSSLNPKKRYSSGMSNSVNIPEPSAMELVMLAPCDDYPGMSQKLEAHHIHSTLDTKRLQSLRDPLTQQGVSFGPAPADRNKQRMESISSSSDEDDSSDLDSDENATDLVSDERNTSWFFGNKSKNFDVQNHPSPRVQVFPRFQQVVRVAAGSGHFCAITDDLHGAQLYSWGSNSHGQTGLNTMEAFIYMPSRVEFPSSDFGPRGERTYTADNIKVRKLTCGPNTTICAGLDDRTGRTVLFSWGSTGPSAHFLFRQLRRALRSSSKSLGLDDSSMDLRFPHSVRHSEDTKRVSRAEQLGGVPFSADAAYSPVKCFEFQPITRCQSQDELEMCVRAGKFWTSRLGRWVFSVEEDWAASRSNVPHYIETNNLQEELEQQNKLSEALDLHVQIYRAYVEDLERTLDMSSLPPPQLFEDDVTQSKLESLIETLGDAIQQLESQLSEISQQQLALEGFERTLLLAVGKYSVGARQASTPAARAKFQEDLLHARTRSLDIAKRIKSFANDANLLLEQQEALQDQKGLFDDLLHDWKAIGEHTHDSFSDDLEVILQLTADLESCTVESLAREHINQAPQNNPSLDMFKRNCHILERQRPSTSSRKAVPGSRIHAYTEHDRLFALPGNIVCESVPRQSSQNEMTPGQPNAGLWGLCDLLERSVTEIRHAATGYKDECSAGDYASRQLLDLTQDLSIQKQLRQQALKSLVQETQREMSYPLEMSFRAGHQPPAMQIRHIESPL